MGAEAWQTASEAGGVAAVERALAILAAIGDGEPPVTLATLSAQTGFYKSTILRLLVSLERTGYVQRLEGGRYLLGPASYRLGLAYERANPLHHHVVPALRELVAAGSESASFHIWHDDHSRLCLFRVDSAHATLDRVRPGDVLPLDRGAAGRILLAFRDGPGAQGAGLRDACFTLSVGEREEGCSGMAVPVFAADRGIAGALSLSGPSSRFTEEVVALWRPRLLDAAFRLSRVLGGDFPELLQ